jgi:hypothetical protein
MNSLFLPVRYRFISALAVSALLGASVFGQAPPPKATPPAGAPATPAPPAAPAEKAKPLGASDVGYVTGSVKSMNYLMQLANAGQSLTDPAQTRLRDSMKKDLTAVLAALNKIVEAHAMKVSTEVTGTDKADLDRVTKLFAKPDKVDPNKAVKGWVAAIAKESKRLDHETETTAKTTQDADLKTFVSNYRPSIRNVFTSAEGLEKGLLKKK